MFRIYYVMQTLFPYFVVSEQSIMAKFFWVHSLAKTTSTCNERCVDSYQPNKEIIDLVDVQIMAIAVMRHLRYKLYIFS